jgi:ribokinase
MDLVVSASHIPGAGETILGNGFAMHPGGKGANQAVAVARLGWPVEMIGMLGRSGEDVDAMGGELRAHLLRAGVGIAGVGLTLAGVDAASGVALISVAESGENSIVVAQGANAQLTPEWIEQQADRLRGAAMVLVQLEIPLETVMRVAEICAEAEVPLMLDPAPACDLPKRLFPLVTWMTPNETEAAFYAGTTVRDPAAVAAMLQGHGVAAVVVKMGASGAFLSDAEGYAAHVEPFVVQAIDSTAAGDAWNAAFAVALVEGRSTVEAARFASAAAAISVTRAGAQESMATRGEVLALLEEHAAEQRGLEKG